MKRATHCPEIVYGFESAQYSLLARPHLHLLPIAECLAGYRRALRDAGLEPLPPLVGEVLEPGTGYALRTYANASGPDINALREALPARSVHCHLRVEPLDHTVHGLALSLVEVKEVRPGSRPFCLMSDGEFVCRLPTIKGD